MPRGEGVADHARPLHVRVCPICGLFWRGQAEDACFRCGFLPQLPGARRVSHHRPSGGAVDAHKILWAAMVYGDD